MLHFVTPSGERIVACEVEEVLGAPGIAEVKKRVDAELPATRRCFRLLHNGQEVKDPGEIPVAGGVILALCKDVEVQQVNLASDVTRMVDLDPDHVRDVELRIAQSLAEGDSTHEGAAPAHSQYPPLPRGAIEFCSVIAKDKGAALVEAIDAVRAELESTRSGQAEVAAMDDDEIAAQVCSMVPQGALDLLLEMGFGFNAVQRALLEAQFDQSAATEALLSGAVSNRDLASQEWQRFGRMYLARPAISGQRASNPMLVRLLDMGFSEREARSALRGANGVFDEACAALLGDPAATERIQARQASVAWIGAVEMDVRAGLADASQIISVVRAINSDPQAVLAIWHDSVLHPSLELLVRHCCKNSESELSRTGSEVIQS